MLEVLFYKFFSAWIPGHLAFFIGRYVRGGKIKFPKSMWRTALLYLLVWVGTFLFQIAFGYMWSSFQWGGAVFAEFILPISAGAYLARQLILLEMQRGKLQA